MATDLDWNGRKEDLSLAEIIDYEIANNKDKNTTDADIRYFETVSYLKKELKQKLAIEKMHYLLQSEK